MPDRPHPPRPAGPVRRRAGARLRLHGWRHPAILSAATLSAAAGFAQFSVTATLGEVAAHFGEVTDGLEVAAQVGLTGTTIGIGLAVIRIASLGGLPLAALADRRGRRRVILWCAALGLAVTALASLSPAFWVFVVVVALARPMLSATNAVAGVIAGEETRATDRAKAMALLGAAYAVGAGIPALLRGVAADLLGFRGVFALVLVPLLLLPLLRRRVEEPDRFAHLQEAAAATSLPRRPVLGRVAPEVRPRLWLFGVLAFAMATVTGPMNTNLFVYAENVLGMSPGTLALVILAAGPVGLTGLLAGRWAADHLGRRVTAAAMQVAVALAGMLTYSGRPAGVAFGYLAGILAAGAYTPSFGALSAELFPTRYRSTAAGWLTVAGVGGAVAGLVVFGVLIDAFGAFGPAAVAVTAPAAVLALLYARLPETRGMELEQSAPDPVD